MARKKDIARFIGRFKDPGDGYPPFVEVWAYDAEEASRMLDTYCQDNSFELRGLHPAPMDGIDEIPGESFCRDFEKGERPGAYSKQNVYIQAVVEQPHPRLTCPKCGDEVKDDPKNPGKVLCYTCKKRMPKSMAVLVEPQEEETGKPGKHAASTAWLILAIAMFVIVVALTVLSIITGAKLFKLVGFLGGFVCLLVMLLSTIMLLRGKKAR